MEIPLHRWLIAALILVLGGAQAWDAGVLGAAVGPAILVTLGVLAPALAVLSRRRLAHAVALVVAVSTLAGARSFSPVPLPGLFMILPLCLVGLLISRWLDGRQEGAGAAR